MTLLASWLLSEASSGTSPTSSADGQASPANLALEFDGSGAWTSNPAGNGLGLNASSGTLAKVVLTSKFAPLNGSKTMTYMMVMDFDSSNTDYCAYGIERPGLNDVFYASFRDGTTSHHDWDTDGGRAGETDTSGVSDGTHVVAVVWDTAQATQNDRYRFYVDGVLLTSSCNLALNATINFAASNQLTIGNDAGGGSPFPGGVYAFLLWDEALSDSDILSYSQQLLLNNDREPLRFVDSTDNSYSFGNWPGTGIYPSDVPTYRAGSRLLVLGSTDGNGTWSMSTGWTEIDHYHLPNDEQLGFIAYYSGNGGAGTPASGLPSSYSFTGPNGFASAGFIQLAWDGIGTVPTGYAFSKIETAQNTPYSINVVGCNANAGDQLFIFVYCDGVGSDADIYAASATGWTLRNPPGTSGDGYSPVMVLSCDALAASSGTQSTATVNLTCVGNGNTVGTGAWMVAMPPLAAPSGTTIDVSVSDTPALTDSILRAVSTNRILSDSAALTDSVSAGLSCDRSASDTAAVTDASARSAEFGRVASDTAAVTDSVARSLEYNRTLADTAAVTDSSAWSVEYSRSASDTVSTSEATSISLEASRSSADTAATSDSLTASTDYNRSAADALALSDSASAELLTPSVVDVGVSDTASVTDALASSGEYARSVAETIAATDATTLGLEFSRAADDTAAASDATLVSRELSRVGADTVSLSDALTTETAYVRSASDTLSLTDDTQVQVTSPSTLDVQVSDSVSITELLGSSTDYRRAAQDSLSTTDGASAGLDISRAFADTLGVGDSLALTLEYGRALGDSVSTSDSLRAETAYVRALADALATFDDVGVEIIAPFISVNLSDALLVADSVEAIRDGARFLDHLGRTIHVPAQDRAIAVDGSGRAVTASPGKRALKVIPYGDS